MVRTHPVTIDEAKIRRYIRQAIAWHKVDNGMPECYNTDNYKHSKRVDGSKRECFYYVKSDRAIREIAKKIRDMF